MGENTWHLRRGTLAGKGPQTVLVDPEPYLPWPLLGVPIRGRGRAAPAAALHCEKQGQVTSLPLICPGRVPRPPARRVSDGEVTSHTALACLLVQGGSSDSRKPLLIPLKVSEGKVGGVPKCSFLNWEVEGWLSGLSRAQVLTG